MRATSGRSRSRRHRDAPARGSHRRCRAPSRPGSRPSRRLQAVWRATRPARPIPLPSRGAHAVRPVRSLECAPRAASTSRRPALRRRGPGSRGRAPAEHAVELGHAGRDALAFVRRDVTEGHRRRRPGRACSVARGGAPPRASRTRHSRGTCRASAGSPCRTRCTCWTRTFRGHAASLGTRSNAVPRKSGRFACKIGARR